MSELETRPSSGTGDSPKKASLRRDDDDFDIDKELDSYIEEHSSENKSDSDKMEKGQQEALSADRKEDHGDREPDRGQSPAPGEGGRAHGVASDNEDSEADDYNLTEDQRRALAELDNLKNDMGYPDEDPPEYNVKERLKVLNEDLKNDPTPVEKQKDSKISFKQNLVDLVAPPPDFSDDEEGKKSPKQQQQQQQQSDDKVDDKSESVSGGSKKSNPSGDNNKKDKVLIEMDGQFQLVDADDVRARDFGIAQMDNDNDKENERRRSSSDHQPAPPGKPRPATASANSRRNVRVTSAKQRPQSAQPLNHKSTLDGFSYNSPYALSPREKEMMEERKKAQERQKQQEERDRRNDNEKKDRENRDAFDYWLKKKREEDRRKKIVDEDDRKKSDREDRRRIREFEKNKGFQSFDMLYYKTPPEEERDSDSEEEDGENEEAFRDWLRAKHNQFKKEKLLKKRQEQEMHDGYYVRSREECDKAYRQWLKQKAVDARRARAMERQKAKLQRLAARRSRKSVTLGKSIRETNSFRYVDYYGYRF